MLKSRGLICGLLFALALVGGSFAQTQAPAPDVEEFHQPEQSQPLAAEQPRAVDPRGTEESPLIVKVLPPTQGPTDSTTAREEGRGRSMTDWLLLTLIGFLVVVGTGQAIAFTIQARQLREAVRVLMSGECALIHPTDPNASLLLPIGVHAQYPENPGVPLPIITCEFTNIGSTAGIIKEVRGEIFLGVQLPRDPTYAYSQVKRVEIVVRPEKNSIEQRFEYNRNFSSVEIELINERKIGVLFFGYVKYADVFGRLHTRGFGFICRGQKSFQSWGGRAYNFTRSDEVLDKLAI